MTPTYGRPDLRDFVTGALYMHDGSDELVEYIGVALGALDDGEDVGVFRFVSGEGCLLATQRGYQQGERFVPAGEQLAGEVGLEG